MAVKDLNSNSWTTQVREILYLYNLPSSIDLIENMPSKNVWKKMVKKAVHQYWIEKLRKEAETKKTLCYLNTTICDIGQVHPVWRYGTDPIQVAMAATKARLLVQRYALTGTHNAGRNKQDHCPLCHGPPETLIHFILDCPSLIDARNPYMKKFLHALTRLQYQAIDKQDLIQKVLDPSPLITPYI